MPASATEPGAAGERLGGWVLLRPLGEGGMARVYLARKDGSPTVAVLKRLHVRLEASPVALKRFQREAQIASVLDHPAIAKVIDSGVDDGRFFLVVEHIAGRTLEAVIAAATARWGSVPLPIALSVAFAMLDGLTHAHEHRDPEGRPLNIVHRDLTPRNVMVGFDGRVSIIDFGIAKGDVDEFKTAPGVLMGTPYYMSPEQAKTEAIDARSDLYTFGAVLFELLAGRRLATGRTRAQVLLSVASEPAPPLSRVSPALPRALEPVLARALEKAPAHRWPSARELREALRRASSGYAEASAAELEAALAELFPEGREETEELRGLTTRAALDSTREVAALPEAPSGVATTDSAASTTGEAALPRSLPDTAIRAPLPDTEVRAPRAPPGLAGAPADAAPPAREPGPEGTPRPRVMPGVPPVTTGVQSAALPAPRRSRSLAFGAAAFVIIAGLAAALYLVMIDSAPPSVIATAARPRPSPREGTPAIEPHPAASAADPGGPGEGPRATPAGPPRAAPSGSALEPPEPPSPAEPSAPPGGQARSAPEATRPALPARAKRVGAQPAAKGETTAPGGAVPAAAPVIDARMQELSRLVDQLERTPSDAELRGRLYERFEADGALLPAKRRARVQAAIDEAIRSVEVEGFRRAMKELQRPEVEGTPP